MNKGLNRVARENRGIRCVDSWSIRIIDYIEINGKISVKNLKNALVDKYAIKEDKSGTIKKTIGGAIFRLVNNNQLIKEKIGSKVFIKLNDEL